MSFMNRLFGPPGNVKRSIERLITSGDEPVHKLDPIIDELGKIGKPAVQPLCAILKGRRTSYPVRCLAAIALIRIGNPSVQPLKALLSDKNEEVRIVASATLMSIQKGIRHERVLALTASLKENESVILATK